MNYVGFVITLVIIGFVAYIYTALSRARSNIKDLYSEMDILLQQRWELVLGLIPIIEEESAFEEKILEKLEVLKNQNFCKLEMEQKLAIDSNMSKVVSKMLEMGEKYSSLTSDDKYIFYTSELQKLEKEILKVRSDYDKSVKEYNTKINVMPNNIIAILFGFNEGKILKNIF